MTCLRLGETPQRWHDTDGNKSKRKSVMAAPGAGCCATRLSHIASLKTGDQSGEPRHGGSFPAVAGLILRGYNRSTAIAVASPPPMQRLATPLRRP
jgi:hypothetical protein